MAALNPASIESKTATAESVLGKEKWGGRANTTAASHSIRARVGKDATADVLVTMQHPPLEERVLDAAADRMIGGDRNAITGLEEPRDPKTGEKVRTGPEYKLHLNSKNFLEEANKILAGDSTTIDAWTKGTPPLKLEALIVGLWPDSFDIFDGMNAAEKQKMLQQRLRDPKFVAQLRTRLDELQGRTPVEMTQEITTNRAKTKEELETKEADLKAAEKKRDTAAEKWKEFDTGGAKAKLIKETTDKEEEINQAIAEAKADSEVAESKVKRLERERADLVTAVNTAKREWDNTKSVSAQADAVAVSSETNAGAAETTADAAEQTDTDTQADALASASDKATAHRAAVNVRNTARNLRTQATANRAKATADNAALTPAETAYNDAKTALDEKNDEYDEAVKEKKRLDVKASTEEDKFKKRDRLIAERDQVKGEKDGTERDFSAAQAARNAAETAKLLADAVYAERVIDVQRGEAQFATDCENVVRDAMKNFLVTEIDMHEKARLEELKGQIEEKARQDLLHRYSETRRTRFGRERVVQNKDRVQAEIDALMKGGPLALKAEMAAKSGVDYGSMSAEEWEKLEPTIIQTLIQERMKMGMKKGEAELLFKADWAGKTVLEAAKTSNSDMGTFIQGLETANIIKGNSWESIKEAAKRHPWITTIIVGLLGGLTISTILSPALLGGVAYKELTSFPGAFGWDKALGFAPKKP